jgi:hypothetical protein
LNPAIEKFVIQDTIRGTDTDGDLKNLYMPQIGRAGEVGRKLSAKSMKTALKGTSIEEKDAKEIISGVQAMYDKIPGFIRPMLPSLPDILKRIPPSAGKYSLNEIIQLLDWAYDSGQLKK